MSREKDCKWHFGRETGREQLSDPMSEHFKDDLYTSLVRESIQNSLDAAKGPEPVRVEFLYKQINSRDFPNFFGLRNHIQGCIDYYGNDAKKVYKPMLDVFPELCLPLWTIKNSKTISMADYTFKLENGEYFYSEVGEAPISLHNTRIKTTYERFAKSLFTNWEHMKTIKRHHYCSLIIIPLLTIL